MATTDEILKAAQDLGKLVGSHEAAAKLRQMRTNLQSDTDAQRLLNDYNRHLSTLAEKEQAGKPIEVDDKRKLDQLQGKLIQHPLLGNLQIVQMDYLDLMRRVDDAITGNSGLAEGVPVAAPQGNPGAAGGAAAPAER